MENKYQCQHCARFFIKPNLPHRCGSNFRKHKQKFKIISNNNMTEERILGHHKRDFITFMLKPLMENHIHLFEFEKYPFMREFLGDSNDYNTRLYSISQQGDNMTFCWDRIREQKTCDEIQNFYAELRVLFANEHSEKCVDCIMSNYCLLRHQDEKTKYRHCVKENTSRFEWLEGWVNAYENWGPKDGKAREFIQWANEQPMGEG